MQLQNKTYIRDFLMKEARWCESHGARGDFLGAGLLYYTFAFTKEADLCVCLGSGGGFVPRLMAQAQRDLMALDGKKNRKTIIVDANTGQWGRPTDWHGNENSFFRKAFPEIEFINKLTSEAVEDIKRTNKKIGYLHIDADHSYNGVLADLKAYYPLVHQWGVITLHDTGPEKKNQRPPAQAIEATIDFCKETGAKYVNWGNLGEGVAIIIKE